MGTMLSAFSNLCVAYSVFFLHSFKRSYRVLVEVDQVFTTAAQNELREQLLDAGHSYVTYSAVKTMPKLETILSRYD